MKNTLEIQENFSNINIYTQWLKNNKKYFNETKKFFKLKNNNNNNK